MKGNVKGMIESCEVNVKKWKTIVQGWYNEKLVKGNENNEKHIQRWKEMHSKYYNHGKYNFKKNIKL